ACGEFAGLVLALDARRATAFAESRFELLELFDKMAHVRQTGGVGHFSLEKSVGSRKTESTFWTILPLALDSALTFFHSGSLLKSAQFFLASSRLGCARM